MIYKNKDGKKTVKIGFFLTIATLTVIGIVAEWFDYKNYTDVEKVIDGLVLLVSLGFSKVLGKKDEFLHFSWGKKKSEEIKDNKENI